MHWDVNVRFVVLIPRTIGKKTIKALVDPLRKFERLQTGRSRWGLQIIIIPSKYISVDH